MPDAVDLQKDFIQMPFVAGRATPSPQPSGIQVAELVAPAPDRFVADDNAARGQRLFRLAEADCEAVIERYGIRDDFSRETMDAIRVVEDTFSMAAALPPRMSHSTHEPF